MESNLKDRFEDFGSAPSNELWDRIESTLDEKPQRKPLFWWLFYAVASIFVVGIMTMHFQTSGISNNQQSKADLQLNKQMEKDSFGKQKDPMNKSSESSEGNSDSNVFTKGKTPKDPFQENLIEKNQEVQVRKVDRNILIHIQDKIVGEENKKEIAVDSQKTNQNNQHTDRENEPFDKLEDRELEDPKMDVSVKPNEELSQKEKDSSDNTTIGETKSNSDSILSVEKDNLKETAAKLRFEIGFSYSYLAGQQRDYISNSPTSDNSFNSVPSTQLSNETFSVSDSNTKYYDIAMPLNFHLNFAYYFNPNWRLDNDLGYSQFKYTYLDEEKNKLADHVLIHSISIPLSISYITTIRKPQFTLNYGAGVFNDFSFGNWNTSNQFYYGLSAQIKLGYGYRFGVSESWKFSVNFVMRQTLYEGSALKSSFNNRFLYGGQIGIAKCFF